MAVGNSSEVCLSTAPTNGAQLWFKPLGHGKIAILLVNALLAKQTLALPLSDVPTLNLSVRSAFGGTVRDLWAHEDASKLLSADKSHLHLSLGPHASAFIVLDTQVDAEMNNGGRRPRKSDDEAGVAPAPVCPHPFCDYTLSEEKRLSDLVSRLNTSEMIGQLTEQRTAPIVRLGIKSYSFYGACLSGFDDGSVVGDLESGTTAFPSPITRGASWDVELEREITSAVGDEVRGVFDLKGFGAKSCNGPPGCNLWRDPR